MKAWRLANPGIGWQVAASLAPPLIAGAFLIASAYQAGREELEQACVADANNISLSIDARLAGIEGRLAALATLAAAADPGQHTHAFAALAMGMLQTELTGSAILLLDDKGQPLFHSAHPYDAALPSSADPGHVKHILATAHPGISAGYAGSQADGVVVAAPVLRGGQVVSVLEMQIPPGRVLDLLRSQPLPPGRVATLLDRDGRILARSRHNSDYAGRLAGAGWITSSAHAGVPLPAAAVARDPHTYTAYARSELTGWTVALEAPRAQLEQPLRRLLALRLAVTGTLLASGMALGLLFAGRTRRALRRLGDAIAASAAGDISATVPRAGAPEIAGLAEQFNLLQQARRHARAELRLAASVFSGAAEAIIIADQDGTIIDVNQAFTRLTGFSRAVALGAGPQLLRSERQDPAQREAILLALARDGHWHGEIWLAQAGGGALLALVTVSAVRDEAHLRTHYVTLFSDVTGQHEERRDMERMAYYDTLTQLPNRRLLQDRIRQAFGRAARNNQVMALACLDLDGFKPVNDNFGHDAGDLVLKTVAARLGAALRPHDTAARLGGDEFVLLISDLLNRDESETILRRVLQALAEPILLADGKTAQVSASIGVALYPADGYDGDQLLRQADQAMYRAKRAGRNRLYYASAATGGALHETGT